MAEGQEDKWTRVHRLLQEWDDAEAEARRVTEQYISVGYVGVRNRIKFPPKMLDRDGMDEMDAADRKAKKAREAYEKALEDAAG